MRRREFIVGLGGAAAWPLAARAQQPAMPVVGFLSAQSADDDYKQFAVPFLQGLQETGYVEGQNVTIEYRWAANQLNRLPVLVADLVRRHVAVIVAVGSTAALPTKAATTTIPIVFITAADPVALGLVASLSRPGANLTGFALLQADLAQKRLQLLHELLPNATQFGVLVDPASSDIQSRIADLQTAARSWACNSLLKMPELIAISKRRSQFCRNSMLVRSCSPTVPFTTDARNNSRRLRPGTRCPRCSQTASSPWPAA
jgi:putative tryptophan/tyrosine transport system substrate-binding protein